MQRYGNRMAKPVDIGPRVAARVVNSLLFGVVYSLNSLIPLWILRTGNFNALAYVIYLPIVGTILGAILVVWELVLFFARSTTIGGASAKVKYLKSDTGEDASGKLLVRYLVSGLFETVTFGLGAISYFVTYRDGQHWIDRAFSVVGVDRESITPVAPQSMAPSPGVPQIAEMQSRVTPVRMPQRPGVTGPAGGLSPLAGPPRNHAQSAPQGFGVNPNQSVPPATPRPNAQPPQPRLPGNGKGSSGHPGAESGTPSAVAPSPRQRNPWAIGADPSAPAQEPVRPPVSFAPPGQAELSTPVRQERVAAPPPPMLSDETVLDPEDAPEGVITVILDDGQRISLETPVVLGRNPLAQPNYPGARCIAVVDESMRLSKSHVVVAAEDGAVTVVDIGATNGIHLEVDGSKTRLSAQQGHVLPPGSVLHFGGRNLRLLP